MIAINKCKICQCKDLLSLKSYRIPTKNFSDLKAAIGDRVVDIRLVICRCCGFVFYDHILSPEEMERLYISEERGEREKKETPRAQELNKRALRFMQNNVSLNSGKIIDIGAGDFSLLEGVGRMYKQAELHAINVSYKEDFFEGIKVHHQMLENFQTDDFFDVIILSHIMEHIATFSDFLSALKRICHERTLLYVEVPYQLGVTLFLRRNFHTQHINYFSPESLRYLFEENGFLLQNLEFDRSGYSVYGIPGIIRASFKVGKEAKDMKKSTLISTIIHLLDPTPYANTFLKKLPS